MTRLLGSEDLAGLVDAASRALGIPQADIEKDIWVVEVLRSVFQPIAGARVVFKGGTSLSKAYGIIERFSEDVDLLIVADDGVGRGTLDRILKDLPRRAATALGITGIREGGSETGVHRSERLAYPAVHPDLGRVKPGVLLEMGVRGGPEPAETRMIRSYAADWALSTSAATLDDFEEFAPVALVALRPERTLIEKLGIVHHLASTFPDSAARIPAAGRHVYDIFRLLGDDDVLAALLKDGIAATMAADADRRSATNEWPFTPRPSRGFATSPAFSDGPAADVLAAALSEATTLVWGAVPTYQEVVGRVRSAADVL